jgi:TIR domain
MATPRVFVSHSHEDRIWCHSYVEALRQGGADVCYDEQNLSYGVLMDEIERDLAARAVFSVVLSPKACTSQWVPREMAAAIELLDHQPGRILLPVVAVPCDIPLLWRPYKRISGPNDLPLPPNESAARVLQALRTGGARTASDAPPEAATPHERMERSMTDGAALATAG